MKKLLNKVNEFHKAFKVGDAPNVPTIINHKEINLRAKLQLEELHEYEEAAHVGDIVEVADALGDQLYILCGTILKHGLQDKIEDIFNEIHFSNMSKLDENGEPIFRSDGKVLKGKDYFKPDLKQFL